MRSALSDTDRACLDIAGRTYRHPARRDADVLAEFGWSPARFAQVLGSLLDSDDARAYAPLTVGRLVRLRDARRAVR